MPGGEDASEYVMDITLSSLDIFDRVFGDYPYAELDVVELMLASTAIEDSGLITLATDFWVNGNTFAEGALAHEVAHQWWFGVVGNNQVAKSWVDEGGTTYSEAVYYPERYNEDTADRLAIQASESIYANFRSNGGVDVPMETHAKDLFGGQFRVIYYDKGRLFYNEMERLISRESVYEGLRRYYQDMKYDVAYANDILRNMESVTEQELDAFFFEWVGNFDGLDQSVVTED